MKEKNEVCGNRLDVMLVFVSPVTRSGEVHYAEIQETVIQTNEAGLLYVQQELNKQGHSLDNVYCLSTPTVLKDNIGKNKGYSEWIKSDVFRSIGDVTHFEFLCQRMSMHSTFWDNRLIQISCNDLDRNSDKGSAQILADVAKISDRILQLREKHKVSDIVVHCDITGGFRHASAMLMVILQLLHYNKVKTGKVVYTDIAKKIYEINNLQSMFILINGADEFVKYGSTQALEEYFADIPDSKRSEQLKNLLPAMEEFSQAIRLCVPNIINMVTIKLKKAIDEFSRSDYAGSLEEEMLGKLINRIADEYKPFVTDGSEKYITVNVIRWCMKKGLWQQAMTFAFELLPSYICNKRIVYPAKEDYKKTEKLHRQWENNYIVSSSPFKLNDYVNKENTEKQQAKQDLYMIFEMIMRGENAKLKKNVTALDIDYKRLESLLLDIKNADKIIAEMKKEMDKQTYNKTSTSAFYKVFPRDTLRKYKDFAKLLKLIYFIDSGNTQSFLGYIYNTASRNNIVDSLLKANIKSIPANAELVVLMQTIQEFKLKSKLSDKEKNNQCNDEENADQQGENVWNTIKAPMWSFLYNTK